MQPSGQDGPRRGLTANRAAGVIADEEQEEIAAMVRMAEVRTFRPLLYLIPYAGVAKLVKKVAVHERANPLSSEYIIERLPRSMFDIIQLEEGA